MGKGGYAGGSTLYYFSNKADSSDDYFESNYVCPICSENVLSSEFDAHMATHGFKICYSCMTPYKANYKRIHICKKCGAKILLKVGKRKKLEKGVSKGDKKVAPFKPPKITKSESGVGEKRTEPSLWDLYKTFRDKQVK